jgi:hypothetical protein
VDLLDLSDYWEYHSTIPLDDSLLEPKSWTCLLPHLSRRCHYYSNIKISTKKFGDDLNTHQKLQAQAGSTIDIYSHDRVWKNDSLNNDS